MTTSFVKRNEIAKKRIKQDYFTSIYRSNIVFNGKIPPAKIKIFPLKLHYSLTVSKTKKSTSLLKSIDEKFSEPATAIDWCFIK